MKRDNKIDIYGAASQKIVKSITVNDHDLDLTLMEFLRKEQLPVASSCYGEGICQKCVVKIGEVEQLSCLLSVRKFMNSSEATITISYL